MDIDFWTVLLQIVCWLIIGELTYQMWELWKNSRK